MCLHDILMPSQRARDLSAPWAQVSSTALRIGRDMSKWGIWQFGKKLSTGPVGSQAQFSGDAVYSQPLTSASRKCLVKGKEGPGYQLWLPRLGSFKTGEFRSYIVNGRERLQRTEENGSKPGLNHPRRKKRELELLKPNYSVTKLLPESRSGNSGCYINSFKSPRTI